MRRLCLAFTFCTLFLVSICPAQQTFNNPTNSERKGSPAPPPGPVLGGDGTPYYIPIWRTNSYLLDSVIYQTSAGNVGIGTVSPGATLDVNGGINAATTYSITGTTVLDAPPPGNLDVGLDAGQGGSFNTFLGWDAGKANGGAFNIFIGASSGWLSPGGENNIAIGYATALTVNGDGNIMIGQNAGGQVTSGNNNTFVGNNAGYYVSTGNGNTYLGNGAGMGETSHTGSNNIFINNAGTSFDVNTTRIGQSQSSAYLAGVYHATVMNNALPVYVDSNGQLGTVVSSRKFKEQVRDMGDSTDALMKLRPVTFLYKSEYAKGDRTLQYGLIAEEVAEVYPELVIYDQDGAPYAVRYQYLASMLLNEVQKQYHRAEVEAEVVMSQQAEIESLQKRNAEFQARLSRLEQIIGSQVQTVSLAGRTQN